MHDRNECLSTPSSAAIKMASTQNVFEDVFKTFCNTGSIELDAAFDFDMEFENETTADMMSIDTFLELSEPVWGYPMLGCVFGFPAVVDGTPFVEPPQDPYAFIPEPALKSKNTDVTTLKEVEDFLKGCITRQDDMEIAKQDYVMFGDGGKSSRDLDRNKDTCLVLKMVGALYGIPLHRLYQDLGNLTCFSCVKCGEHRPQRGGLLCFYCAKVNKESFSSLVQQYVTMKKVI